MKCIVFLFTDRSIVHSMHDCSQVNQLYTEMLIVYEIVRMYDVNMYVYKIMKLKTITRLCMYIRRVNVYVYEFTNPNVTTRVCVYVARMYVMCLPNRLLQRVIM